MEQSKSKEMGNATKKASGKKKFRKSFTEALKEKYCSEDEVKNFSFIIIRPQRKSNHAELAHLKTVALNNMNVNFADIPSQGLHSLCPNVVDLDIADNDFQDWSELLTILHHMPQLKFVNASRNPLSTTKGYKLPDFELRVENFALNQTGISIVDLIYLSQIMPKLKELHICGNSYDDLGDIDQSINKGMLASLQCLRLNNNNIQSWSEVWKLRNLPQLRELILSENPVENIFYSCHSEEISEVAEGRQEEKEDGCISDDWVDNTHLSDVEVGLDNIEIQIDGRDAKMLNPEQNDNFLMDDDDFRPVSRIDRHQDSDADNDFYSSDNSDSAEGENVNNSSIRDETAAMPLVVRVADDNSYAINPSLCDHNNSNSSNVKFDCGSGSGNFPSLLLSSSLDTMVNASVEEEHSSVATQAEAFLCHVIENVSQVLTSQTNFLSPLTLNNAEANIPEISGAQKEVDASSNQSSDVDSTANFQSCSRVEISHSSGDAVVETDTCVVACDVPSCESHKSTDNPIKTEDEKEKDVVENSNIPFSNVSDVEKAGSKASLSPSESRQLKTIVDVVDWVQVDIRKTPTDSKAKGSCTQGQFVSASGSNETARQTEAAESLLSSSHSECCANQDPLQGSSSASCQDQNSPACSISKSGEEQNQPSGLSHESCPEKKTPTSSSSGSCTDHKLTFSSSSELCINPNLVACPSSESCRPTDQIPPSGSNSKSCTDHNPSLDSSCESCVQIPKSDDGAATVVSDQPPFCQLRTLCVSHANLMEWEPLEALTSFPELVNVRLQANPLYSDVHPDDRRKLYIASLPKVKMLNGSEITKDEREKAERFFLRHFMDQESKPDVYHRLVQTHGPPVKLVDINLRTGFQEWVNLNFVYQGKVAFSKKVHVVQPVRKLRPLIASTLKLRKCDFVLHHLPTGPLHQDPEPVLESLVCENLPMSRYDISEGDEIHVDI